MTWKRVATAVVLIPLWLGGRLRANAVAFGSACSGDIAGDVEFFALGTRSPSRLPFLDGRLRGAAVFVQYLAAMDDNTR